MYDSIDSAMNALHTAELDVAADMGEDALEAGWSDLVRSIASCCTVSVGRELIDRLLTV